jgi:ABC-type sulfate transport system permease subunit
MGRRFKALLAGVAAAVASLFVSLPATVVMAERFSSTVNQFSSANDEITFRTAVTDISLLPAFLLAVAAFVSTFIWMRRREAR